MIATGIMIIVLSFIPLAMLRAWVISWLWFWFAVPLGAPVIGVAWALGISSLAGVFQHIPAHQENEDESAVARMGKAYAKVISFPLIALFTGWIAHSFMVAA